jgi:hypothetical protein
MTKKPPELICAQLSPGGPMIGSLSREGAAIRQMYFCHGCRQLRLGKPHQTVEKCAGCGSTHLSVGKPNDTELLRLRFGLQLDANQPPEPEPGEPQR